MKGLVTATRVMITPITIALIMAWSGVAAAQSSPAKPDVFLITIDTLRADHVHCYGYAAVDTPALDALAKDGIRFSQAYTASPITNTSHASVLTGLLPGSHGVTDFAVPLSAAHPTLAELLKPQGYQTGAFIGAVILDSKTLAPGFDRGFDFYDNFPEQPKTQSRWGRIERRGMEVVEHAETWLNQHPAGHYFLWVHLYDPHDPYEPPAPFFERYKDHLYDGEIAYADSALAHFIAYLKKIDRYENSIIIVVGDHGEGLGEHHEETHGIFLYDATTHVPLIVKLPRERNEDMTVSAQVRTVDILPTILDLTDGSAPPRQDGESLRPYFDGKDSVDRPAFGETDYPLRFGWAPLRSVRSDGFKFIEAPRPELYELQKDAAELNNKYEAGDSRVRKARTMLADLHARENSEESSVRMADTGANTELRALGYVPSLNLGNSASQPLTLPDPKDKIEEQNLLHAAMIAAEDSRPAEGRGFLEKALLLDPKSPTVLGQLGEMELQEQDFAQAAQHLKTAAELRPGDATLSFHAGQALLKTHDAAGARTALEASLKLAPDQFPARLLLGQIYLELHEPVTAEDQFEAALLLQSDSVDAELGLADAQLEEHHFAEAAKLLEDLSKVQPGNAHIFQLLAKAYSGLGKTAEAQRAESKSRSLRKAD
jgi:choline-sulfatase